MEKFYSKESKESEEKNCMKNVSFIDRENRTPQKWAIEDIKTIPMEKLQNIKTVEFITHPLYKFLYETFREPSTCKQENLIQLINDENISFEEIFLTYLNQLLEQGKQRDTSKFFLSNEFLKIMESLEEISNYRKIDSTKLKIFCLPNILDDLNPTQITLINKFLKQYNHENIYTLNTEQATNWILNTNDRDFLKKNLPLNANIEVKWWYLSGCLDNTINSLQDINKDIILDTISSTDPWAQSLVDIERNDNNRKDLLWDIPFITFPDTFISLDEAISWLKSNPTYVHFINSPYHKMLGVSYKQEFGIDSILSEIE